ncbi:hypothetical protein PPACK8108_LOCUS18572 [Phakopsora pachyrhizi]|uniref:Uncharacterized protein n=1 Tax=Phakopsora pachyrhizi TaxID=170000 RepID=A0AAV0BDC2_PHAPC|nr:hypothetical protein PPACK8108_LOCUS18572 [Phakopsora pachyrhizi]
MSEYPKINVTKVRERIWLKACQDDFNDFTRFTKLYESFWRARRIFKQAADNGLLRDTKETAGMARSDAGIQQLKAWLGFAGLVKGRSAGRLAGAWLGFAGLGPGQAGWLGWVLGRPAGRLGRWGRLGLGLALLGWVLGRLAGGVGRGLAWLCWAELIGKGRSDVVDTTKSFLSSPSSSSSSPPLSKSEDGISPVFRASSKSSSAASTIPRQLPKSLCLPLAVSTGPPSVSKDDDCEEERDYHSLPHDQIEYGPIYNVDSWDE